MSGFTVGAIHELPLHFVLDAYLTSLFWVVYFLEVPKSCLRANFAWVSFLGMLLGLGAILKSAQAQRTQESIGRDIKSTTLFC